LAKYGKNNWSSPEQKPIEKLKLKITTKSQITNVKPGTEAQQRTAAAYNVPPHLHKTPCCWQVWSQRFLLLSLLWIRSLRTNIPTLEKKIGNISFSFALQMHTLIA